MADVKHAPYPWIARPAHGGIWDVFDGDSHDVVTIFGGHAKHHAHLISAAPELLTAGKHLAIKLIEVYRAAGANPGDCQAIRDWIAAVAKTKSPRHD